MISVRWLLYPVVKPLLLIFPEFKLSSYIGSNGRAIKTGDFKKGLQLASDGLELLENIVRERINKRSHVMVEISWGYLGSMAFFAAGQLNDFEKEIGVSSTLRKILEISPELNFLENKKASGLVNRLQMKMASIDPEHEAYWQSLNKKDAV